MRERPTPPLSASPACVDVEWLDEERRRLRDNAEAIVARFGGRLVVDPNGRGVRPKRS